MPTSRRTGGCTFPEDPAQACASVLPIWSAGVDPRVLAVRAVQPVDATGERVFDALSGDTRIVRGPHAEHLLIDCGGEVIRLDVIDGTAAAGPDRKSVVEGKSVSVRVDLGGRRSIKKKKTITKTNTTKRQ